MKKLSILFVLCLMFSSYSLVFAEPAPQPVQPAQPKEDFTVANFEKLVDELIAAIDNGKTLAEIESSFQEIVAKHGFKTLSELQTAWAEALGSDDLQEVLEKKEWSEHIQKLRQLDMEARSLFEQAQELNSAKKYTEAAEAYITLGKSIVGRLRAICYYNASCAYSLHDDKRKASVWFAEAVKEGYRNMEHISKDSDLDNIRKEEMYLYLVKLIEDKETKQLDSLDVAALEKKYYEK